MKFRHLVSFTHTDLTVDFDVYRMSRAHFSHFSFASIKFWISTFIKSCGNPRLNEKLDTIHEEIHAGWLFTLYDYLTGAERRKCILKG